MEANFQDGGYLSGSFESQSTGSLSSSLGGSSACLGGSTVSADFGYDDSWVAVESGLSPMESSDSAAAPTLGATISRIKKASGEQLAELSSMELDAEKVERLRDRAAALYPSLSRETHEWMARVSVATLEGKISSNQFISREADLSLLTVSIGSNQLFFHLKGEPIGEGTYKQVWEAVMVDLEDSTVDLVAHIKLRKLATDNNRDDFIDELVKAERYNSPYVSPPPIYIQHYLDKDDLGRVVVYAKLEPTDLNKALHSSEPLTTEHKFAIACDLIEGLMAIHQTGDVHRDLKPANILLGEHAVIADLGCAGPANGSFIRNDILYRAPESILYNEQGTEADIWQLGHILYEMSHPLEQRPPLYRELSSREEVEGLARMDPAEFRAQLFTDWLAEDEQTEVVQKVIAQCLSLDPAERPTLEELQIQLAALVN